MTETIGVRELKSQASQILRAIRESSVEYVVTVHNEPVAVLRPYTVEDENRLRADELTDELADIDALAQEIAASWKSQQSGLELIEEQRR
ncbi:MAG: type II toxin-antitoxin system Phd/YefM family antitoxin [Caldilineales bacterium]|nr:type II toxin-antitoxin system Phd/YefM family antitoxin [Caldilineales bacterium]